jgi:hypothetical protein
MNRIADAEDDSSQPSISMLDTILRIPLTANFRTEFILHAGHIPWAKSNHHSPDWPFLCSDS